ncbi:hypothetical protein QJS10_CPB11g01449 [Acorus calamus]|uniref:VQ domain-containing protein n=1 Tax=Acorus calamus TaxID=4465 RepID=A0AAV9DTU4_ACOCL|nr:hypothetical protein QJS10_CPB11g01449 [Acorus calamus]
MAMSDSTTTTTTTHSDWAQTFQRAWSNPLQQPPPSAAAAAAAITSEASTVTAASSSNAGPPGVEGRVGKTPRRRSRASRKPPTTLLNTDPSNFRAMVQRFTGVPSGGFPPAFQSNGPSTMSFGYQDQQAMAQYHQLQYQQQQQHQYQHQQQQQQYMESGEERMISLGNPRDMFVHGFENPGQNLEVSDLYLLNNIPSHLIARSMAPGDGDRGRG